MKRTGWLLIVILLFGSDMWLMAQSQQPFGYYRDVLPFAQSSFGGTARFQSIGGANYALGGDISSAHMNPAGLGFNRRSEFSFTPGFSHVGSRANYVNENFSNTERTTTNDSRLNLNFGHLGAVFSKAKNTSNSKFLGGSFAISASRVNDFNSQFTYEGVNDATSIIDFFLNESNGNIQTGFFEDQNEFGVTDLNTLAYFTYLINPITPFDDNNVFYSFVPIAPTAQFETVTTRGAQYEWNFAYGANFDDRFYVGASVGLQTLRFEREKQYEEFVIDSEAQGLPLNSLQLNEVLSLDGFGINATGGLIYRVSDRLRIGLTATTPTLIRMNDSYQADLFVQYNNHQFDNFDEYFDFFLFEANDRGVANPQTYAADSASTYAFQTNLGRLESSTDPVESSYNLVTPYRIGLGASTFVGKKGFISADLEAVGYNAMQLSNPDANFSFDADNRAIKDTYQTALNIRLGGELRLDQLRLRAGFAHYGSPFQADGLWSNGRQFVTAGIGTRKQNFYMDFAIIGQVLTNEYLPYELNNSPETPPRVSVNNTNIRGNLSFGFFF